MRGYPPRRPTTEFGAFVDLDAYEDVPGLPSWEEPAQPPQLVPVPDMAHTHGANPDGKDPLDSLRQLFKKQDLDEAILNKFAKPKDANNKELERKIDSPSRFWRVGVSAAACYNILAAF